MSCHALSVVLPVFHRSVSGFQTTFFSAAFIAHSPRFVCYTDHVLASSLGTELYRCFQLPWIQCGTLRATFKLIEMTFELYIYHIFLFAGQNMYQILILNVFLSFNIFWLRPTKFGFNGRKCFCRSFRRTSFTRDVNVMKIVVQPWSCFSFWYIRIFAVGVIYPNLIYQPNIQLIKRFVDVLKPTEILDTISASTVWLELYYALSKLTVSMTVLFFAKVSVFNKHSASLQTSRKQFTASKLLFTSMYRSL